MRAIKIGIATLALCTANLALGAVITFTGTGQVTPISPPDQNGNFTLIVIEPTTNYDLGDGHTWHLNTQFNFNLITNLGTGSFNFSDGPDSLSGTLTTVDAGAGPIAITYLVNGSTGVYAGLRGSGTSTVQLLGDRTQPPTPFTENGSFTLSAVPEPGSMLLICLGIAALIGKRRRA